MTAIQMSITIAVCTAATMLTRFLPFVVFSSKDQQPPEVVRYLGRVLPAAIFGMLIVYCLKSVTPFAGSRGAPEGIRAGCQPRLIWIPMNVITVSVIPFLKEAKMILPQS